MKKNTPKMLIKRHYFLSVNATFIPRPMSVKPQNLLINIDTLLFSFNFLKIAEAKIANIKHQINPVVINVVPSARNGKIVFFKVGSINWGKNAMKNKATFGFKTFVKIASRYIFQ